MEKSWLPVFELRIEVGAPVRHPGFPQCRSIRSPADLGLAIRAVRRSSRVRIDDLAATAGVSKQFTSDVEHGKPTVQFGLVFKLLAELGVPLEVDIPEEAARALATLRSAALGAMRPPPSK